MERLKKVTIIERRGRGFVVEYRDENGKRPRPCFKTKAEAEAFVEKLVTVQKEPKPIKYVQDSVTLKDAIRRFTAVAEMSARGKKTAKSHFETLFVWFVNEAKVTTVEAITLEHLDRFKAHLLKELSPNSVRRMFATYSSFFNRMLAWGIIAKSPMKGFRKPSEVEANIKTWSQDQVTKVAGASPKWAADAIKFLAETGCRPVDAERLVWKDVDLEAGTIVVRSFKGGQSRQDTLQISESLVEWLSIRKRNHLRLPENRVFGTPNGGPVTADSLQDTVRRKAEALGFEGLTVYGLRHTYADSLVNLGVHPRDIQELMRHKKFETTTRYTKRKNDHLKRIVEMRSKAVTTLNWSQVGHKQVTNEGLSKLTGPQKALSNQTVDVGAGERARTVDLYLGKETTKVS